MNIARPHPRARRGTVAAPRVALLLLLVAACAGGDADGGAPAEGPLVVFTAGSLARPMRAALDSFARREGVPFELEAAGSLETARKLTELDKIPDVIALADEQIFPALLQPRFTTWYARFARNRVVLVYSPTSRHAPELSRGAWRAVILEASGVEVGRADPDRDPGGYRALLVMQLAEKFYGEPGLARRLEEASPRRNVRPKEVDLVALLQTGELDVAWLYESVARATGLPFVPLPPEIDLGSAEHAERYATATLRVLGARVGDTLDVRGAPIRYALSIPEQAPHRALGERFVDFLFAPDGQAALRGEALDAHEEELVGARPRP